MPKDSEVNLDLISDIETSFGYIINAHSHIIICMWQRPNRASLRYDG